MERLFIHLVQNTSKYNMQVLLNIAWSEWSPEKPCLYGNLFFVWMFFNYARFGIILWVEDSWYIYVLSNGLHVFVLRGAIKMRTQKGKKQHTK